MLDVGPVNVRGAIKARLARVVWADGTLHVAHKNGSAIKVQRIETSEPQKPKTASGYWRAESDAGMVSFTSKGCGG